MESASPVTQVPIALGPLNSRARIAERVAAREIPLAWPILIVLVRPLLAVLSQSLVALVLSLNGADAPFEAAGKLWRVYGSLVDLGCLAILIWLLKREGIRLLDLLSFDRVKLRSDVLLGVGVVLIGFPLTIGAGSVIASFLVYGTFVPQLPPGLLGQTLPLWALLYSRLIWWPIWSIVEELTYQGYALPRLLALGIRTPFAIAWVGFGWALQHCFLPLFLDWHHVVWTLIMFLPLVVLLQLVYLRVRRLTPLVIAHWAMDFASTWMVF